MEPWEVTDSKDDVKEGPGSIVNVGKDGASSWRSTRDERTTLRRNWKFKAGTPVRALYQQ